MTSPILDEIRLHGLQVQAIIGVLDWERQRPQRLDVEVVGWHNANTAGRAENLDEGLDYRQMVERLRFVLQQGQFLLLETAAEVAARALLLAHPALLEVSVTLGKPEVFDDSVVPSLHIHRRRAHLISMHEEHVGKVDTKNWWSSPSRALFEIDVPAGVDIGLQAEGSGSFGATAVLVEEGELRHASGVLQRGMFVQLPEQDAAGFVAGEKGARLSCLRPLQVTSPSTAPLYLPPASGTGVALCEVDYVAGHTPKAGG